MLSDFVQPTMDCPRCGAVYEDFDGFGVVFCEACRFCRHLARSGRAGSYVCDFCGDETRDPEGAKEGA